MSFKVETSKTLSNIHTTKSYQTKNARLSSRSTVQTPNEHVLWKGVVGGKGREVGSGIVETQQHQKNVTEEKDSAAQSHYLQNKTRVSNLSIPHPQSTAATQKCIIMLL